MSGDAAAIPFPFILNLELIFAASVWPDPAVGNETESNETTTPWTNLFWSNAGMS